PKRCVAGRGMAALAVLRPAVPVDDAHERRAGNERQPPGGTKGESSITLHCRGPPPTRPFGGPGPPSWALCPSPIGDILLVADDSGLRELHLPGSFVARDDLFATASGTESLTKAAEQL